MLQLVRVAGVALSAAWAFPAHAGDLEAWIAFQRPQSVERLLLNVSPPGTARGVVIASPSKADPDYFYHWIRDAALVMEGVRSLEIGADPASLLRDFAELSRSNQASRALSGLGEPKFNVDGSPYSGPWGRPQDDGPALRALILTRHAGRLLSEGSDRERTWVRSFLYDGRLPTASVIKADLEYVSHRAGERCFDLWEEIEGRHFYTAIVQRRALIEGAALAARLGDPGAADWYSRKARELEDQIRRHLSAERGYVLATLDRSGGHEGKTSGLDSSVILAALHGAPSPGGADPFLPIESEWYQATAARLDATFRAIYPVNSRGPAGAAIGRYPEDTYYGGNPWFLTTAALAEYHYRLAEAWERAGEIRVRRLNAEFLRGLVQGLEVGAVLSEKDPRFGEVLLALTSRGDGYLERIRLHGGRDGSLSEQIDRGNGYMMSARDLTWSHAAFLTAAAARDAISR